MRKQLRGKVEDKKGEKTKYEAMEGSQQVSAKWRLL